MQLQQQLGLYQVFLKLYEYHRNLLDEILQMENSSTKYLHGVRLQYVQGMVRDGEVYLITNLVSGKTQRLLQRQGIWTFGSERLMAVSIPERSLSSCHAAIRYIENQGFYLIDFNSAMGSFINGEFVYGSTLLQDGDRVRLGTLTFTFFVCDDTLSLDDAPSDVLAKLDNLTAAATNQDLVNEKKQLADREDIAPFCPRLYCDIAVPAPTLGQLSFAQKSEILERFFNR